MSALREAIDANQTGDPDTTTDAVFDALGVPAKWRSVFGQVVRDECRRTMRAYVRDLENHPADHNGPDTHAPVVGGVDSRSSYLSQRFYNGTEYVTWGAATVADHQGRIDFQTMLKNGINVDIERHREAIALIVEAGRTCLADLDMGVAA